MGYSRTFFPLDGTHNRSNFAQDLGLKNLGISVYCFRMGEGFDFFHNHREQEEVYLCLSGTADLMIQDTHTQRLSLNEGDIIRVDAQTLRAIGNVSSEQALVLIAGACPHPYPAGYGYHDVIADVLSIKGKGDTGFMWPADQT